MPSSGHLALIIVLSLAGFFAVVFGLLLWTIRRRRRNSSNVVRDRIERMHAAGSGAVEPEEAGFQIPGEHDDGSGGGGGAEHAELRDVDEFGLAPAGTGSSSSKGHAATIDDDGEPQTWLSSTTSSGTKSYLGGWFGLDTPSLEQPEERGSRDERLKAIQDSMRKKERIRVAEEDDSDTDTIRGDGGENELGETRDEEELRLAG